MAPQYHRETKNYKTADIEAPAAEGHTAEREKRNYRYWVGRAAKATHTKGRRKY